MKYLRHCSKPHPLQSVVRPVLVKDLTNGNEAAINFCLPFVSSLTSATLLKRVPFRD